MSIPHSKRKSSPLVLPLLVFGLAASVFVATNGVGFFSKAFTPGTVATATVTCSVTQRVDHPISVSMGNGKYLLVSGNTTLQQPKVATHSSSMAYYALSSPCTTLNFYEYASNFALEPVFANLAAHPFLRLYGSVAEANTVAAGKSPTDLLNILTIALQKKDRLPASELPEFMSFSDKLQSYYYAVTGKKYIETIPQPRKPAANAKKEDPRRITTEVSTKMMQEAVKVIFSSVSTVKDNLLPLNIAAGEVTAMPLSGTVVTALKPDGTTGSFVVVFYNALGNGKNVVTTNIAVAEITKELIEQGKFPKILTFTRATLFSGSSAFSNMHVVPSSSVNGATAEDIVILATDHAQSTGTKLLKISGNFANLYDSRKVMYCSMSNVRKPVDYDVNVDGSKVIISDPVGIGSQNCTWTTDKSLASVVVQSVSQYGTSYASLADGTFHVALSYSSEVGRGLIQDFKGFYNMRKSVGSPVSIKGLSEKCRKLNDCGRAVLVPNSLQAVAGVYRVSYIQNTYALIKGKGDASTTHLVFGVIDIILPKQTPIPTQDPAVAYCEQSKGKVLQKGDGKYCILPFGTLCELQSFYKKTCPTTPTPTVTVSVPPIADLPYKHCTLNKGVVIADVEKKAIVRYCKLPNGTKCELTQYYNNLCPTVPVTPTVLPPDTNIGTAIMYCYSNKGRVARVKDAASTAYKYVCNTANKTTCDLWQFYYGTCK